jgi:hypothetical protein
MEEKKGGCWVNAWRNEQKRQAARGLDYLLESGRHSFCLQAMIGRGGVSFALRLPRATASVQL